MIEFVIVAENRAQLIDYLTTGDFANIPALEDSSVEKVPAPRVSVLMLAFNHGEFIEQAIESVLSQDLKEPFELVIGDDLSQDDTLAISRRYAQDYPGKIRVICSRENVGMHRNFARLWHHSRAPLLAFCEGDDYWIDPEKLKRQLAWFEENPDGVLCGSDCDQVARANNGQWVRSCLVRQTPEQSEYSLEELIRRYTFHFSTVMVRKDSVRFPRWFWDSYCVDRPLYLLAAQNGRVGHIGGVTSVYRQHSGGAWSQKSAAYKADCSSSLFEHLRQHFGASMKTMLDDALAEILWSYMSEAMESGDFRTARRIYWRLIKSGLPDSTRANPMLVPAVFLRSHFPGLYRVLKTTT